MKLAFTAGGTGGHIFPALSVLAALRARRGLELDIRFYGPDNRGERDMLRAAGVNLHRIPAAAVRDRGPLALARSVATLTLGTAIAFARLLRFRPAAVFSTGGYASFPACLAARLLRRPLLVYLPDVSPGWAVRAETRLATRLATTTEAALAFLPAARTRVTGYPVRPEFFTATRDAARNALGIPPDEKLVVITGASQGAQRINQAVFGGLRSLVNEITVVHVTGSAGYADASGYESQLGELAGRYVPAAFRDDLPTVMLAADLAVCRAGASILGELTAAALPAILVPATYAGGHQRDNAEWLASHGAAIILDEANLEQLPGTILNLINDELRLAQMARAAKSLARPDAAWDIANLLVEVAS
jgi:UDP-N-acetylglucosamine--N-acetylmuramyl-(pentapeptide) pyrophosphoryl-undecaprenol N-acetylglucosamine transferase